MANERNSRLAPFARLEPRTPWTGGRTAHMDVLTLEDAAHFAGVHAGQEVTAGDFLRAAARGEIQLHAVLHRSARTRPCTPDIRLLNNGVPLPAGALVWLSLDACQGLAVAGRASWRTLQDSKRDTQLPELWRHFDAWELEPEEPSVETVPADCRVTGYDAHALADAFLLEVEEPEGVPRLEVAPKLEGSRSDADDGEPGPSLRLEAWHIDDGLGAQILRGMLAATPGEIREMYGVSPEEAALSLRCHELASLPAWDHAAMLDAATAQSLDEEQRLLWGLESREALARRIALAMRAEDAPELLHPADAVLLLERHGIHVFHELRDAVRHRSLSGEHPTEGDIRRFRALSGAPRSDAKESAGVPRPGAESSDVASRQRRGFFTLEEAAQALGEQERLHGGARQSLLTRMLEARRDGSLTVRDPHTDLPFRPAVVREFWERVTRADVNSWLERCGVAYRWAEPASPSGAANEYADSFSASERAQAVETLTEWFRHDTWTLREGLFLLVGIDPYRSGDLRCVQGGIESVRNPAWARITKRPGVKIDAAGVPSPDGFILDPKALIDLHALLALWVSNPAHSGDWSSRYAPSYFIEWARSKGRPPFWLEWVPLELRPGASETPATAASAAREPEAAAIDAGAAGEPGPKPLDTRTMARALEGIEARDAEGWRRLLGDRPKWAQGATVTPGTRGRESATWDPVKLALLLSETKRAPQDRLAKLFRDRPELEHWRDAYRAALSVFRDYGL